LYVTINDECQLIPPRRLF